MIISVRIVGRDRLIIEWDDRSDGLRKMIEEWTIEMKDVMHQVNCELVLLK